MQSLDIGIPSKPFSVTATNAASATSAASISATYAAVANRRFAVTHFSAASSISAEYTIESPAGTVLWRKVRGGTNNDITENFDPPLVITTANQAVVFKAGAMAATNTASVNGAGYEIYNA